MMHAYLPPEKTHGWCGNWAFGTNACTVWNMSFTGPARDIIKTVVEAMVEELTWLMPCLVLWIRENSVYPRESGGLQGLPPINDPARTKV
jgi:hypothetical protein